MANDRPSLVPVVRSGGTPPVQLALDSGCFNNRPYAECSAVDFGFCQTQSFWWRKLVRSASPPGFNQNALVNLPFKLSPSSSSRLVHPPHRSERNPRRNFKNPKTVVTQLWDITCCEAERELGPLFRHLGVRESGSGRRDPRGYSDHGSPFEVSRSGTRALAVPIGHVDGVAQEGLVDWRRVEPQINGHHARKIHTLEKIRTKTHHCSSNRGVVRFYNRRGGAVDQGRQAGGEDDADKLATLSVERSNALAEPAGSRRVFNDKKAPGAELPGLCGPTIQ